MDAGKIATVALKLEVAKQATTVEVAAEAVAIETASSAETSIIDTKQLLDIPLNGRDFTQLLKFNPGANAKGSLNGSRLTALTGRSTEPTTTTFGTTSIPSIKAACRALPACCFRLMPSPSSLCRAAAMLKRAATRVACLNVVIKSGTNSLHGSAYYFNRNESLAAADWFTPPGSPTYGTAQQPMGWLAWRPHREEPHLLLLQL